MTEGSGRRLHLPMPVRWGDLDAYNHVNNVAILKILEEARIRAFWRPAAGESAPSTAVLDASVDAGSMMLIARQEIEYYAPIPYHRDPLDVQMWFARLGGSSVEVCYDVYSPAGGSSPLKYATAAATAVMVSVASGAPERLSREARDAWSPFLGAPIAFRRR